MGGNGGKWGQLGGMGKNGEEMGGNGGGMGIEETNEEKCMQPVHVSERSVGRDPGCLLSTQPMVGLSSPTGDSLSLAFKT